MRSVPSRSASTLQPNFAGFPAGQSPN